LAFDVLQQSKLQNVFAQQLLIQEQHRLQLDNKSKRKRIMLIGVCVVASLWFGYEPAKVIMQQMQWQGWLLAALAVYIAAK